MPNDHMHWTGKAWLKRASAKLSPPVMWVLVFGGKMAEARKIIYYFPHLNVNEKVIVPGGVLYSYNNEYKELGARHDKFVNGSLLELSKFEVEKIDSSGKDLEIQKLSELIKFSYFSKNLPHTMNIHGFISLETFDMFRLIENNVDKSFEHKIVVSNGMCKFSQSSDQYLLARKEQAIQPITVCNNSFSFELIGTLDHLKGKEKLYSIIHLYNKSWELQSIFNSFLDKPVLAKTSIEMLIKYNKGSKKDIAKDFIKLISEFINEYKSDKWISSIVELINSKKGEIEGNITKALDDLKSDRDDLLHDGSQNFNSASISFYMVWFPLYWALTINRKNLNVDNSYRFLCFLCLCKFPLNEWDTIGCFDAKPKHSHLSIYVRYSNILPRISSNEEKSKIYLEAMDNWLKEN